MKFRMNGDGELTLVEKINPIPEPNLRLTSNTLNGKILSVSPILVIGASTVANASGHGVFWEAFMTYIFPWMLDIAKVFCAIKIAQGFYQEKRGGKDSGTGMGAFVTYGKWYLLFSLMPWAVELIDELGSKMLGDLQNNPM